MGYSTKPCRATRCTTCPYILDRQFFESTTTRKKFACLVANANCKTVGVVYLLTCQRFRFQYVGETKQSLNIRFRQHYNAVKRGESSYIYQHFHDTGHSGEDMRIQILDQIVGRNESEARSKRLEREDFWIRTLVTARPFGLNTKILNFGNIDDTTNPLNKPNQPYFQIRVPRLTRSHGKKRRAKKTNRPNLTTWLANQATTLQQSPGEFYILLRSLAKKDIAHLLLVYFSDANCVLQQDGLLGKMFLSYAASCFPSKSPPTKKPDYYLPVNYHNLGMEKLKLHTLFKDRSLNNLIPVDRKLLPKVTVTYAFQPPISLKIFNYSTFLSTLNPTCNDIHTCNCNGSPYVYAPTGHITTGNLDIIQNKKLKEVMKKGTNYRVPNRLNWAKTKGDASAAIDRYSKHLATKFNLTAANLNAFKQRCITIVDNRIAFLKKHQHQQGGLLWDASVEAELQQVQAKFILVPADKAANNYELLV